jgi:hypothetical protein
VSSKKASNYPGLHPVKVQQSGPSSKTGTQVQFWSLSLSAGETLPHFHVLVTRPALDLFLYVLP